MEKLLGATGAGPIADRIVQFEAETVRVFCKGFAANDASIGAEIAAEGAEQQVLIGSPETLRGDACAVAADIDGLRHFEAGAVGERQANKHPLGDAFFGALACGGVGHGHKNPSQ